MNITYILRVIFIKYYDFYKIETRGLNNMNTKKNLLFLASVMLLFGCKPAASGQTVTLEDNRQEVYIAVIGETDNQGHFAPYDDEVIKFKSLYEATNFAMEEGDTGSYVYVEGDQNQTKLFKKLSLSSDYWFYYKDGNVLDGYAPYTAGDAEFYKGEDYTRVLCSGGYAGPTYQPYELMGHESTSTQAWNRLPYLDTSIRYNPHAFTGIQDTTYTFELSQAKIRPSYNEAQKAVPTITMSTTDSYNWSNQGIYMDTETGNWYYLYGETQSQFKSFVYEKEVIMTSSWDQSKQEWTPSSDVRLTLNMVQNEDDGSVFNKLTIELLNGTTVTKTVVKEYEYNQMNMRGTHRASIDLDLIPTDEEIEEESVTPDFQCGAYFKNVIVSEGKGTVREGLTDEIYQGDEPMCCEAGHTYDLLYALHGYQNDSQTEVILDGVNNIKYKEANANKDTWDISFEQHVATSYRTAEVLEVEELISLIPAGASITDDAFRTAYAAYKQLDYTQTKLIEDIDGYTAIKDIIG